jgi:putative membrane protein
MKKFIIELILTGVAVMIATYFVPGLKANSLVTAMIAGVALGFVNATLGGILRLLTFPINLMTLGLMSFVISVLMVLLVDHYLVGFNAAGSVAVLILAVLLSVVKVVAWFFK